MWQNIIIAVIVLLCALYVGRRFYRQARGKSACGCECSGCPSAEPGGSPKGSEPPSGCGSGPPC